MAITIVTVLCLCPLAFMTISAESEGSVNVTGNTSKEVRQGSSYSCYVYIDSLKDVTSLDVEVRFDSSVVSVLSSYNRASCTMYDKSIADGCIRYLYLMDGKGSDSKTTLFYFSYTVATDAKVGTGFFDIIVNEAYNSNMKVLDITGSRCQFNVVEPVTQKTCGFYATSSVNTSIDRSFDITYYINTTQVSSGSFTINYDSELLSVERYDIGQFLGKAISDVHQSMGAITVSFASHEYSDSTAVITVAFRPMVNVDSTTEITFTPTELCDLDLNDIKGTGCNTSVKISYDDSYVTDKPRIYCSSSVDVETGKLRMIFIMEQGTNLGAGDFTLRFDTSKLTYESYEQIEEFKPTYFIVNETQVTEGILKFSILSTDGLTEEYGVMEVVFDAPHLCEFLSLDVELTATGLADRLTNPIVLNVQGTTVNIPPLHSYDDWIVDREPTCTEYGQKNRVCAVCGERDEQTLEMIPHQYSTKWTSDQTYHWHACEVCSTIEEGTQTVHQGDSEWVSDSIHHWHACPICGQKYGENHHVGGTGADVTCSECGIVYNSIKTGDFNHDGKTNSLDSLILKKRLANWTVAVSDDELDLNGDGKITSQDSLLLKKKLAGWDVEFASY